jgi:hypothetical protein
MIMWRLLCFRVRMKYEDIHEHHFINHMMLTARHHDRIFLELRRFSYSITASKLGSHVVFLAVPVHYFDHKTVLDRCLLLLTSYNRYDLSVWKGGRWDEFYVMLHNTVPIQNYLRRSFFPNLLIP